VFFKKIVNDLFHQLQRGLSGFMDPDPETALKGPVQILGDLQFQFNQRRMGRVVSGLL